MLFLSLFYFFVVLSKKISSLDIIDRIFYEGNEVKDLVFSLDYRREGLTDRSDEHNLGEEIYGYAHKSVEMIFPINSIEKIKNYFSVIPGTTSCAHFLIEQADLYPENKEKCINKDFCEIIPKNVHMNGQNIKDMVYCARISESHIVVYSIGPPVLLEPNIIFQDLFFEKEKKGIINCYNMYIDILFLYVHTPNGCLHDKILKHIISICDKQNICEINFYDIDRDSTCLNTYNFYVNAQYECIPKCSMNKEGETCDAINPQNKTCKYGYSLLKLKKEEPGEEEEEEEEDEGEGEKTDGRNVEETCQKNIACLKEICSLNEYCDIKEGMCKCRHKELESLKPRCEHNNVCMVLACPSDATCEYYVDGKHAECKCKDNKIFYNNKCFTSNELELDVQIELKKKNIIYKDHLYEGSALESKYILLYCESDYYVEVINAYVTCYKVQYSMNKMKYITEVLEKECNGKTKCIYGNNRDHAEEMQNFDICNNSKIIFKYQYLCKAKNQEDDSKKNNKIEIFRSRFKSKLQCNGGKITVHEALLKTGEGCEDLNLTTYIKSYCDDLSNCDIGSIYHFDSYCINDQYLFVNYECTDLCSNCPNNASCYGNRHKHECFCDKPYISKNNRTICEKPTSCDSVTCGTNQVCKEENNNIFCECENGYKNVDGTCIEDDGCNLLCPSNKSCFMKDGSKTCKCINGYKFKDGKCVCSEDHFTIEGNKCVPRDKCKRKEYEQICTNEGETCLYNEESDIIRCVCKEHYEKNNRGECKPINYCLTHTCGRNEICKMINFTPQCECKENFRRESNGVCIHENLCVQNRGNCPPDSTCIYNEDGPHECKCNKSGHIAIDGSCVLEDKCSRHNICSENSICVNIVNKDPLCVCMFNYFKRDGVCVIRNPCLKDNGGCPKNSVCVVKNDKVTCECKENYKNKSNLCIPDGITDDKAFELVDNNDASITLGSCGIIEFNPKSNQIVWKINNSNESYVFDYEYPPSGNVKILVKDQKNNTVVYLKKIEDNKVIFDDFQLDHDKCSYEHLFFYHS